MALKIKVPSLTAFCILRVDLTPSYLQHVEFPLFFIKKKSISSNIIEMQINSGIQNDTPFVFSKYFNKM